MSVLASHLSPPRRANARLATIAYAMGGLLLLYAGWQFSGWTFGNRTLVGDAFFYPVGLAAVATAIGAAVRCRTARLVRSGWILLALASASYLAGDVAQTGYELAGNKPYPSVADAFYLLFYPLALLGVLRFFAGRRSTAERARLSLDLAVVAIAGFVVVMYVVVGPTVVQSGPDPLETTISIAYPVGDMILLVGLGSVLLRRPIAASVRALQLLAAGLSFYVLADLTYSYITLHSTYHGGDPVDSLWMVAIALFAVAGAAQGTPEPATETEGEPARRRASWAPFLAVAVGFGVLLLNQRNDRLFPDLSLLIAAFAMAVLVSIRQFLAQHDLLDTQGQLSYQSLHDALTGLPNRALVIDRATQMLVRARRAPAPVAALYVDIDGFKQVNDSLGHAAGDTLLRVVAARLSEVVRGADTVGRLGGDEFVVLLDDYALDAGPEMVAERICEVIAQPVELEGTDARTLNVTVSVGIAIGQRGSADELLRDADFALYEAKAGGKNRWLVFESKMQTVVRDRVELEMDLREALDREQFFLLYQPTFNLQTETISGVEALVRWHHPVRGVISPDTFIPLAEETGLIVPIGSWVLHAACEQAATWQRGGRALGMAVNVSARQLDHQRLVRDVADTLAATGLAPAVLTLEITETTLMRDSEVAARRLRELKALGVQIAIDDFGTGYSSLSYLRQFPVDALKIDRSFISGIAQSRESKALIHTLVQLGKTLGLETLGEGIEQEAQLRQLQREQCDSGQGFLFARPLAPSAVDELLLSEASGAGVGRPARQRVRPRTVL